MRQSMINKGNCSKHNPIGYKAAFRKRAFAPPDRVCSAFPSSLTGKNKNATPFMILPTSRSKSSCLVTKYAPLSLYSRCRILPNHSSSVMKPENPTQDVAQTTLNQPCGLPSHPLAKYGLPTPSIDFFSSLEAATWVKTVSFGIVFLLLLAHAQTYDPARDSKFWFWFRLYCFTAVLATYSGEGVSKIQAWARSEGCM